MGCRSINLFRICWKNEPIPGRGSLRRRQLPRVPTRVDRGEARIIALVGKWFSNRFTQSGRYFSAVSYLGWWEGSSTRRRKRAVWPSTGNFCRGGAYNATLLGCESIAILPEGMSRERSIGSPRWPARSSPPRLRKQREGDFRQVLGVAGNPPRHSNLQSVRGVRQSPLALSRHRSRRGRGSGGAGTRGGTLGGIRLAERVRGTLGAGDYLKEQYPAAKIVASEALQCPTLLMNGYGDHRIEGIGDKHVPWIHNVRNTDVVMASTMKPVSACSVSLTSLRASSS